MKHRAPKGIGTPARAAHVTCRQEQNRLRKDVKRMNECGKKKLEELRHRFEVFNKRADDLSIVMCTVSEEFEIVSDYRLFDEFCYLRGEYEKAKADRAEAALDYMWLLSIVDQS